MYVSIQNQNLILFGNIVILRMLEIISIVLHMNLFSLPRLGEVFPLNKAETKSTDVDHSLLQLAVVDGKSMIV